MAHVPLPAEASARVGILDFMRVRILRARYFPGAGDAHCDGLTRTALAQGRPAFWSLVSPHRSHFVAAACTANRDGLERACAEIEAALARRNRPAQADIAAFLDRLAPANATARRLLAQLRGAREKPSAAAEHSLESL